MKLKNHFIFKKLPSIINKNRYFSENMAVLNNTKDSPPLLEGGELYCKGKKEVLGL